MLSIKVSGIQRRMRGMGLEFKFGMITANMKVYGEEIKLTAKEN